MGDYIYIYIYCIIIIDIMGDIIDILYIQYIYIYTWVIINYKSSIDFYLGDPGMGMMQPLPFC